MKSDIITRLESLIAENCKTIDREERFRAMLDDCYSFEKVGGPFEHMSPARVLEEMDPVAFRCGVNDYEDGEGWVEVDGEYYDGDECETQKEELISELESEVSDLESEIEDEEAEDEPDQDTIKEAQGKIDTLNAQIAELNKHSF